MVDQLLDICEIAFVLIAACSLAVAAWFELRDRWQTDEERAKTRAWYGKKWEAIRDSGLLELPEKAITSALDAKTRLTKAAFGLAQRLFEFSASVALVVLALVLMFLVVAGAVGAWITYGWIGAIVLASASVAGLAVMVGSDTASSAAGRWWRLLGVGLWAMASLFTACIWLDILLGLDIAYAAGLMFILLPVYVCALGLPLGLVGFIGEETTSWRLFDGDSWTVFGVAMGVSFLVTLSSLLIGSLVAPDAWIPKTLQMLLCNVAFDGFTMVATFAILARAVGEKRKYPIPVAILIDVVVATLFACASLWLGLIGTEYALSIKQVLGVLIAKSAEDAGRYALGPYFWAMHTTFLPTLGYLGLILLFWIAKLVVLPVAKVLKKGSKTDIKPHSLMAGLFAFVGAGCCCSGPSGSLGGRQKA